MSEAALGNRPAFYTPAPMVALRCPLAAGETGRPALRPGFLASFSCLKNLTGL